MATTATSATLTGTTTAFDTELAVGDAIKVGNETFTVSAIASATSLTLDTASTVTASGVTASKDSNLLYVQTGDNASALTLDKTGNLTIAGTITQSGTGVVDGTGSQNYLPKYSDTNTLTNSVVYENNGNVGIGTTGPLQKLHVEGQCVTGDSLLEIVSEEVAQAYATFAVDSSWFTPLDSKHLTGFMGRIFRKSR